MKYVLVIILFELLLSQDIPFFDSIRAMNLLETQCAFGPRFPGSPGSQKMKIFMKKFLTPLSDSLYLLEENRKLLLPSIQREFVWTHEKIEDFFDSILSNYPIGVFLFWDIKSRHKRQEYNFYEFEKKSGAGICF